jgi:hypothetical protein
LALDLVRLCKRWFLSVAQEIRVPNSAACLTVEGYIMMSAAFDREPIAACLARDTQSWVQVFKIT